MSKVHLARPDKNIYFTEQMVIEKPGSPTIDIAATVKRMIIDTTRNWSRNVILWNLAADPNNNPHTDNGGCPMCQGALTLDHDAVSLNIEHTTRLPTHRNSYGRGRCGSRPPHAAIKGNQPHRRRGTSRTEADRGD